ncbi:hypothetical protein FLL45_21995 [Aliikangiella marina]|uniref:Uncharacterized protein n=1 Tax=Aliikangiella marina TaxID=1712262 RepID=A0A545T1B4_9GAMM|nr:hypothetical protein [Aliikangiella marina]TQV71002.1 hypothetical protein FLL45_21995 [Aliikangiella marina]
MSKLMNTKNKEEVLLASAFGAAMLSFMLYIVSSLTYFLKSEPYTALILFLVGSLFFMICYLIYRFGFSIRNPLLYAITMQGVMGLFGVVGVCVGVAKLKGYGIEFTVSVFLSILYYGIFYFSFKKLAKRNGW